MYRTLQGQRLLVNTIRLTLYEHGCPPRRKVRIIALSGLMTDRRTPIFRPNSDYDQPPAYSGPNEAHPGKAPPEYEFSGVDKTQFNNDPKSIAACKKRGISPVFASQLHHVAQFQKIRVAIDVSGSMGHRVSTPKDELETKMGGNSILSQKNYRSPRTAGSHASHRELKTRWQELCEQLRLLFDICSEHELIPHGIDVFFIHNPDNGRGLKDQDDVRSWKELERILPKSLGHGTPTLATVERMFEPWRMTPQGRVLTMIFTDGEPTDGAILDLKRSLTEKQEEYPNSHVTIILCTDKTSIVDSFNQLDRTAPRLDVMDDYLSERAEIRKKQGAKFQFSRDDYAVKLLLGSSVHLWDKLDEKAMTAKEARRFKEYGEKWDWDGGNAQKHRVNDTGEYKKKKPMMLLQKISTGIQDLW
jgi:hypothetical protein